MTVKLRSDGNTGEIEIKGFGSDVSFSEWYNGEGYDFEISRGLSAIQKFDLTIEEIFAIAKIGLIIRAFDVEELVSEVEESKEYNRKRSETLAEIRNRYMSDELENAYDEVSRPLVDSYECSGEYTRVEGWGIQNLDNGDFEVSYKV